MLIFPNLFPKAIGIDRGFRNPIAPAIPIDMPHTKPIEIPICDTIGYTVGTVIILYREVNLKMRLGVVISKEVYKS